MTSSTTPVPRGCRPGGRWSTGTSRSGSAPAGGVTVCRGCGRRLRDHADVCRDHAGVQPLVQRAGRSWRAQQHSQLLRRNAKGAQPTMARRAAQERTGVTRAAGRPESVADRRHDAGREGKGSRRTRMSPGQTNALADALGGLALSGRRRRHRRTRNFEWPFCEWRRKKYDRYPKIVFAGLINI